MPAPPQTYVRMHRFCGLVAFDLDSTETLYLSADMARRFAALLVEFADDIDAGPFTASSLGTRKLAEPADV